MRLLERKNELVFLLFLTEELICGKLENIVQVKDHRAKVRRYWIQL